MGLEKRDDLEFGSGKDLALFNSVRFSLPLLLFFFCTKPKANKKPINHVQNPLSERKNREKHKAKIKDREVEVEELALTLVFSLFVLV